MDPIVERTQWKTLFSNTASRTLLGVWIYAKGTCWPMKVLSEITGLSEEALEAKLQTLAGLGLVQWTMQGGERWVEFLAFPGAEVEKTIRSFYEGWSGDLRILEKKVRSAMYRMLLSATHVEVEPNAPPTT